MSETSSSEKTEKPSHKRLKDAREKGQVPRSRDLVMAMALLAVTLAIARSGASGVMRLEERLASGLAHLGDAPRGSIDVQGLAGQALSDVGLLGLVAGPWLLAAMVIGVAGNVAQSGWVFAPNRLTPDWSRLNPANGLSRLKPSQSGLDLVKTLVVATVVGVIVYSVGREVLALSPRLASIGPQALAGEGGRSVLRVLWRGGFAMLVLAGADYGLQRWRHYTSLKMTKQEVKDEARSNDGNPHLKARVRRVQRDMSKRRMLAAVSKATVVITNPTHYAVAIEYRRGTMVAPVVLAKGVDQMALRIRAIARDKGVPIVENVPLAQALYKGTEIGDVIPPALFGAVAEVLAYLVRIKQLML